MIHMFRKLLLIIFPIALFWNQTIFCELPHVEAVIQLLSYESQLIKDKFDFKILGVGGSFIEKINKISMLVELPEKFCPTDPDCCIDPRMTIVVLLKHFIDQTNAIEKIRPFLKNYPFTAENFEYQVILPDFQKCSSESNPKVVFVYNKGNRIVYCYRDAETKRLEPLYSEPFDEALEIIEFVNNEKAILNDDNNT